MNKILFIVRIILFQIIGLLFFLSTKIAGFVGLQEFIFVIIAIIYEFFLIKDIIQKRNINNNKRYNILSILCFTMILFILSRCLCDSHFIYHNAAFIKELNEYETILYGSPRNIVQFSEIIGYYLMNNALYFNIIFILLFIYRKINLRNSN